MIKAIAEEFSKYYIAEDINGNPEHRVEIPKLDLSLKHQDYQTVLNTDIKNILKNAENKPTVASHYRLQNYKVQPLTFGWQGHQYSIRKI